MLVLSYGYKKPETGDKGDVFFPALEFNIQRLNDHSHNGTNSAKLTALAIEAISHVKLAAGWVAVVGEAGTYKQTVTVPAGVDLDELCPLILDNTTKKYLSLCVQKLTSTTFEVSINDNTIDLLVLYK